MRFLLGLLLGAGIVLLLAEAANGERVWRDRVAAAVAGVERWVAQAPWQPTDPAPARQPIPRPPDPPPVDALQVRAAQSAPQHPAAPAADLNSASVWVPFHSEMSASGFAARLSDSLDHPFRVERRGPGRYQVVFRYHDEPERQALLAQAERLTGLPL